jgi:hypothetical protein
MRNNTMNAKSSCTCPIRNGGNSRRNAFKGGSVAE